MPYFVPPLNKLMDQFAKLPGIGKKTAGRLAFYVLDMPKNEAEQFAEAIIEAHRLVRFCKQCYSLTDSEVCPVCSEEKRDKTIICVVEDSRDVMAFERTREYTGLYHVLGGLISPMEGITPDKLKVKELLERVTHHDIEEVIMATDPTVEGEATALYLSKLLKPFNIKTSRLAYGVPVGGDLEYADEVTLTRALEGRNII